jgi:hypothetical protein
MNNEVTTALMGRLREIVSREPWSQDDLAEWANEFLYWFETDEDEGRWREAGARQEQQVGQLKPQVGPYLHDPTLPPLPDLPDGRLHGIGFIYDEDRDDRVLVAIDRLKDNPGLVALAEHEGCLKVYARLPVGLTSINVCGDEWVIEEFVPYQGRWTEATPQFVRDCLSKVLGHHNKAWQGDPPTARQVAYLRALGYEGPEPKTQGEAGALIAEYRSGKGRG